MAPSCEGAVADEKDPLFFFFLTPASRSSTPRPVPAPQVPSSAVQRYRWRGVSRRTIRPSTSTDGQRRLFWLHARGDCPASWWEVVCWSLLNGKEISAPHFAVFTARPPTPPPLPLQSSRRSSLKSPAPILSSLLVLNLLTSTYSSSSLFFSSSSFLLFYSLSFPLILLLLHQFIHNVCPRSQVQGR